MSTILDQLSLARLRFDLETLQDAEMPAYKGDLLRMALLWWLSEYWCPMTQRCRNGCVQPNECLFGRLCKPLVNPSWPPSIQRLIGDTPPPAYALWDCQDRRRRLACGSTWSFELTLVGDLALRQIPAVVAAVQQGAQLGMGRQRVRNRVRQVSALLGSGELCLAVEKPMEDAVALTWQSFQFADVTVNYRHALEWAQAQPRPARGLAIRYLSPVKIKERGQWVEVPEFSAVMRAVVRRLRLLSQVHGSGEWPQAEYGPLLDLAETVVLEHHEAFWTGYTRHSQRSGTQEIEGFMGQAWYAGQGLELLLPVLWLGQWLHIGKGYVLGNGRYAIERVF